MSVTNAVLTAMFVALGAAAALAQKMGKVAGVVIDEFNAMTLPMAPVEVVETGAVVYTELDGKYVVELPPGSYALKVVISGYQEQTVPVTVSSGRTVTRNIPLTMERFAEEVWASTGNRIPTRRISGTGSRVGRTSSPVRAGRHGSAMRLSMTEALRNAGGLLLLSALTGLSFSCERASAESDVRAKGDPVLTHTFASPEELAREVLGAIEREDVETLEQLPLSKDEFRLYVWPKLPSSRPERNVPMEFVWDDLHQKSSGSIARNFHRHRGRKLELLEIAFHGGTTDYGTFQVHRDARLRVRDRDTNEEGWLDLFGSVMERQGKYKLFSYVAD